MSIFYQKLTQIFKKNSIRISVFIILVTSLIVTALIYWSKPQPNFSRVSIDSWKTYRNEKLGIEFQYPPSLTYVKLSDSDVTDCSRPDLDEGWFLSNKEAVNIFSSDEMSITIACWLEKDNITQQLSDAYSSQQATITPTTFKGSPSYEVTFITATGYSNHILYIPIKDNYYIEVGTSFNWKYDFDKDAWNRVLSSFIFTK